MNNKRILNLGCGNTSYGTDRIDMYKTPTTTLVCNLEQKLPFDNDTFDEVYCRCVLEHIRNIGLLVDEMYRIMKPGAKLYMRTDYAGYLPLYIFTTHEHNKALEVQYPEGKGYGHDLGEDAHYHLFVESHLERIFKKFTTRKYTYVYGGRNKLLTWLLKKIPKKLGAVHIELDAIK